MNHALARPADAGWLGQVRPRLAKWWWVKMAGTMSGMVVFFAAYFWVLRNPLFPVTVMPLTAVDGWIGFQPEALPLYLSLWVYVSLVPALVIERRELIAIGFAWLALSVAGLGIFLLWPTVVPSAEVNWAKYPAFASLKAVDAAGNACPSLHVAFAVFSGCWFARWLREVGAGRVARGLNWLWCAGIAYSTMATRQHVWLDVVAGAALGALVAAGQQRWLRREAVNA